MFRSIAVPLDRSSFAEHALPLAVSLARRAAAALELIAVHTLYALDNSHCGRLPYDPGADLERKQQEQLYLSATANWIGAAAPVSIGTALLHGEVANALLARIGARRTDLIVMTTHARGGVDRFFVGSVADEMLRRASAPVLLVRPTADARPDLFPEPVIDNILIPLDGSAVAEAALGPAMECAQLLGASCTLLRVVEMAGAESEARLKLVADRVQTHHFAPHKRIVVASSPAEAILKEAQSLPNCIIALATHGRGGIRRMLLGSVADKVIRGTSAPVLVCRPQAQELPTAGGTERS